MGAPISEMAGSRQDTRRTWVYFAAVVVGVLAAVLRLLGVDNVEVVATLLFAAVFAATVLAGRVAGYLTAGLATVVYAWLRRDALDDVGVTLFAVVVASRAVSYLVLAEVSHRVADRLPSVPLPGLMGGAWGSPGGAARWRTIATTHGEPLHMAPHVQSADDQQLANATAQWAPDSRQNVKTAEPDARPVNDVLPASWSPLDDEEAVWGRLGDAEHFDEVEGLISTGEFPQRTDAWASAYPQAAPPPPPAPSASEGFQAPADGWPSPSVSPEVPSGWMNEEPLGDETIPVGLTGELFLPEMTGDPRHLPMERAGRAPRPDGGGVRRLDQHEAEGPWVAGPSQTSQQSPRQPLPGPAEPEYGPSATAPLGPVGPSDRLGLGGQLPEIDPGTGLHTAHYLRDRVAAEREVCRSSGSSFSMVLVQMPDTPFQALSHARQVALLRELGHQFGQAGLVDHLIHLRDGARHWFAAVLAGTDKPGARAFERRLRSAIAGYFRNHGLRQEDVESATLTSPDDDESMAAIWSSLLGQPAGR